MTSELKPCPFCGSEPTVCRSLVEYKAEGENPAGEYDAGISVSCHTCGFEMADEYRDEVVSKWNTRAVPDVPELVRYRPSLLACLGGEHQNSEGEYVLYDQAAAVIAAKDAEIDTKRKANDHLSRMVIEAEAELAQIKTPEPVGYLTKHGFSYFFAETVGSLPAGFEAFTVYAAPVDQTAEIERYRKVLEKIADYDGDIESEAHAFCIESAHTALSGKEPS